MTRVLGIDFFQGSPEEAVSRILAGGVTVAPAAPTLAELDLLPVYQRSLETADTAIVDSGFMVLCWRLQQGEKLQRLSGLLLLESILDSKEFRNLDGQLWVMPSDEAGPRTREYLQTQQDLELSADSFYTAPFYSPDNVVDPILLQRVNEQRPALIMLNVAGGKQEILGTWLRDQLDYRPAIICTGAAIAFLTGEQTNIPTWGDRLFLGWLLRIISNPRRYFDRYWRARRLWSLMKRFGADSPYAQS